MPYTITNAPRVDKLFGKIKRKDKETYREILRKLDKIAENPYHFGKPMRSGYKGVWEVHIKNNVLYYRINEIKKSVEVVAYLDHDLM
ncbi:MAG: type II toxin-antitoxin system RelE/ParE family toxin [Candidatus Micrarchaeota archaeon]|nr:type II toxin-antitoxin system RelE/ParE family toxin [Candidatus Micrarchaeota archaeon]MDE1823839.1 type II toxin-antitoxin system RelE/ParE family toxin [Candidatus Micrarchaeota archaeon]MDE1849471.1 type II toxin-antitoxin system RelE/ParE family toxin [Candidatus Micrarchaeota archaeon]